MEDYNWSQDPAVKELRQIKHEGNVPDCPNCGPSAKGLVSVNFIGRQPLEKSGPFTCNDWYCYKCSETFS